MHKQKNKVYEIFLDNSKKLDLYKDVPYIKKKNLQKKNNYTIVASTRLKEKKDRKTNNDLLQYQDKQYIVKEKIFGYVKGYIQVSENTLLKLKSRKYLLFIFLILLFFTVSIAFSMDSKKPTLTDNTSQNHIVENTISESSTNEITNNSMTKDIHKTNVKVKENVITEEKHAIQCSTDSTIEEKEEFWIKYNTNGGYFKDTDYSICLDKGSNCLLSIPYKSGYLFKGWYTNELFKGDEIKEICSIQEDIVLFANWEVETYEIHYNLNGGELDNPVTEYTIETPSFTLKEPTRKGYTFVGWFIDDEIKKEITINQGSMGDLNLIAKWKIDTYNIVYDLKGGEINTLITTYTIETPTFKIETPIKLGYTFIGWSTVDNPIPNIETIVESGTCGDLTFIANWKVTTYEIHYNLNGGELDNPVTEYTIETPSFTLKEPHKKGYTFVGWSNVENNTIDKEVTIEKGTCGNQSYTALWKVNVYRINYDLCGGTLDNLITTYTIETPTFIIGNPVKNGYTFLGWSTPNSNDFQKDITIEQGTARNLTFIANWKLNEYSITYDLGNGKLDNLVTNYTVETPTFIIGNPVKNGYTFLGWSTPNNNNFEKNITIKQGSTLNLTFIANWELNVYDITYNLDGGSLSNKVNTYTVESDTITLEIPRKMGYDFLGWTGSNSNTPNKNVSINKGTTGNQNFIANWKPTIYDIMYDLAGGTLNNKVNTYTIETNTFSIGIPTRNGYDFLGWTGSNSSNPNKNVSISKGSTGNLSYKANWQPITYNISYDLAGGTLSNRINTYTIETNTFSIGIPTRNGYNFLGWTGSNSSNPNKNVSINKGSTGNLSYKANWQPITYNISYDLAGGTLNNRINTYTIETNTFSIGIPTKAGYSFLGWTGSNSNTPSKNVSITKGSIGNLSYKANWKVNSYTVTYLNNDNSYFSSRTVDYNSSIPIIDYSVDQVHIFNGWKYNNTFIDNVKMPSHDITVKADVREAQCYLITGQTTDRR